jgi:hypothetical protein
MIRGGLRRLQKKGCSFPFQQNRNPQEGRLVLLSWHNAGIAMEKQLLTPVDCVCKAKVDGDNKEAHYH